MIRCEFVRRHPEKSVLIFFLCPPNLLHDVSKERERGGSTFRRAVTDVVKKTTRVDKRLHWDKGARPRLTLCTQILSRRSPPGFFDQNHPVTRGVRHLRQWGAFVYRRWHIRVVFRATEGEGRLSEEKPGRTNNRCAWTPQQVVSEKKKGHTPGGLSGKNGGI